MTIRAYSEFCTQELLVAVLGGYQGIWNIWDWTASKANALPTILSLPNLFRSVGWNNLLAGGFREGN